MMNLQAQFSVVSTRSSDLVQCRGVNSHSLSPISHDSRHKLQRVRVASTQRVLRPLSSGGLGCSPFWSGGQSLLVRLASPLCEKEAFVKKKKAPVWRIAAEAPTSASPPPAGGACCPEKAPKEDASPAQKLRIATYFAVWWSLNVVFHIYNKKVLDAYPFPWLTTTLSLAAGSAIMLVSCALGIVEAPHVDCDFWKRLAPGLRGAVISNIAFVFHNVVSKQGMHSEKGKHVRGINYYACLGIMSLAFVTPVVFAVLGPKAWATGWKAAKLVYGSQVIWWLVAQSVFYDLYNQVSYMSLDKISPLTFSICNTIKRVTVIVSSIIIFHTQILPIKVVGVAIAIFGTFLYSQIKQ